MKFNEQQKEIINILDGNVAVIATAGSGKTTTLTYRIKNMVKKHKVNPFSILAITFSKKAKESISGKLKELKVNNINVETFHSLALKIIISAYGCNKYKTWTAQWEKEKLLQDICCNKLRLCTTDDVPYNEIFSFFAKQKVNMLKPNDVLIYGDNMPFSENTMKNIYTMYENEKEKKHYIEFDDFLNIANEIMDSNEEILTLYQQRAKYVLVDEFQDVSMPQALFLKKLNSQNTMIVGDPLQAIYAFRGGDSKYILNFDEEYKGVIVINLNINYRCSQNIVGVSNKLASTIPDSKHRHYVESVANKSCHKTPELRCFYDEYAEGEWISKKIAELTKIYNYEDIAILSRTNAQLQKLETVLHSNNIAFNIVGGNLFSESPEIKLILSYLRLAVNENDDEAFSYLYNKPNRWLDKKFLEEVTANGAKNRTSLYKAMSTIDRRNWRFKNGIDEIFEVINYLKSKKYNTVSELISYLRNRLSIDSFVSKGKQADDGSYSEQIENLDSFESMCSKYSTIEDLLADIKDLNDTASENENDKVQLSTIHKSKGLEFKAVFVIGCNDGLLPHYRTENIDDERRLFYVAITRAVKELYLSYLNIYNNKTAYMSPFVDDIIEGINIISENKKITLDKNKKEKTKY